VAELAKTQRQVEQRDVEGQRQQQAVAADQHVQPADQHCGQHHGHAPDDPGVVRLAGVKVAADPTHPGDQRVMHTVVTRQRLQLLQQQSEQDGKKTHLFR
jgi:hypothetical protein